MESRVPPHCSRQARAGTGIKQKRNDSPCGPKTEGGGSKSRSDTIESTPTDSVRMFVRIVNNKVEADRLFLNRHNTRKIAERSLSCSAGTDFARQYHRVEGSSRCEIVRSNFEIEITRGTGVDSARDGRCLASMREHSQYGVRVRCQRACRRRGPGTGRDDCGGASDAGAKGAQCFRRGSEQPFSSRNRMRSLPERK